MEPPKAHTGTVRVEEGGGGGLLGCFGGNKPSGTESKCSVRAGAFSYGAKTFDLSPDVVVAQPAQLTDCVTLARAPPGKVPKRAVLRLWCASPASAAAWRAALDAARDTVHLRLPAARAEFAKLVHAQLWELFRKADGKTTGADRKAAQAPQAPVADVRLLRTLYFSDWNGGAQLILRMFSKYVSLVQLRANQELGVADARAFAALLVAVVREPVLRVVLLRMPLRDDALAGLSPPGAKGGAAAVERFVQDLSKRAKQSMPDVSRVLLLRHHGHPAADGSTAAAPMCSEAEQAWFRGLYADGTSEPEEVQLADVQAALSPAGPLVLAREHARRGDVASLCDVARTVPPADIRTYDYPSLMFEVPHQHQRAVMEAFMQRGAVDGRFFTRLLEAGLTNARAIALRAFLRDYLFEPGTTTFRRSTVEELSATLQDFPVAVLEAIHRATVNGAALVPDSAVTHTMLEVLFRFEEDIRFPGWEDVTTLSRWLQGGGAAERAALFSDVYRHSGFLGHLRQVYDNNSALLGEGPPAKKSGGLAPASSIEVVNPFVRTKDEVGYLILGLVKIGLLVDNGIVTNALSKLGSWETTVLAPSTPLRNKVVDAILHTPKYRRIYDGDGGGFLKLMRDGTLLNHHMHFNDGILSATCLPTQIAAGSDVGLVFQLVSTGILLQQWESLDASVRDVWERTALADDRKEQLRRIVARIMKRGAADFFSQNGTPLLTLANADDCARYATEAIRMLSTTPETQDKINSLFGYYLKKMPPDSWVGLFKGAETIAFFLKYLSREDLEKAYSEFKRENVGNPLFDDLIRRVKANYSRQLVSADDMDLTDAGSINAFITRLAAAGAANSSVHGVLQQIAAEWMLKTYEKVQTPMAPRNAQVITFLMCAEWAKLRLGKAAPDEQRTLVARVGTGEGKSLIIVMIAIYCAKVLKKKVHVLESNTGLMSRDYADFQDFYNKFGLTSSANDFDAGADITYCLMRNLMQMYRDKVGRRPFDNTVLIVDEVDALIVDGDSYSLYVKPDSMMGDLKGMFDALAAGGGNAPAFRNHVMYAQACSAYHEAQARLAKGEGQRKGYVIHGSGYKSVDEKGNPEDYFFLWQEFLNYTKMRAEPKAQTVFFYQSPAHMLKQYGAILGLSGSLGCPAEKDFMAATFGAKSFDAPPFLNTCRGAQKMQPTLLGDSVDVHSGKAHVSAVVAAAMRARSTVPVVVLCEGVQAARSMYSAFPAAERSRGAVQLLLQYNEKGEPMNWSSIVEKATMPVGSGLDKVWPVTVSDLFGGRGQDYRVADPGVEDAGGLLVVASFIPDSEREWVQWKGRTARNDRSGQYAVILECGAEPISSDGTMLEKFAKEPGSVAHRVTLVDELLVRRDKACADKLTTRTTEIKVGMRMNELCDRFWTQQGGVSSAWPSGDPQIKLRDFLNRDNRSFDAIAEFAVTVNLAPSAEAYKSSSAYAR